MAVLSADFQTGTNGNTVATSDTGSASAFDLVSANALGTNAKANVKYDNTHAVVGSLACMIATGSAPGLTPYVGWSTSFGTQTTHYGRLYLYLTANPSANLLVVRPFSGASTCGQVRIDTGGHVVVLDSAAGTRGTSTNTIALNQWIRIDYQFVHSTTAGSIVAKLYNTASSTTPTETITSTGSFSTLANATSIELGNTNASGSLTFWQASLIANATGFPGPIIANTAAPTISGSAAVGSTLSYSGDTWNVTPTSYTYQWTRAGVNIGGATSSTYTTVSADIGNAVGLKLTAIGVASNETATVSSSNTVTVTGGVANTLTLTAGSMALTGTTATTPTARRLTVSPGAEAVTGASTSLPLARRFTGAAGSLAITGSTASLPLARRMSGTAGAFTITGSLTNLPLSRIFIASAGAETITGQTILTPLGHNLAGAPGSYLITGNQILAPLARILTGLPGSYLLTGDSILTPLQRFLTASPGSVTLTGSTAALVLGRVLSAAPGTFTITGDDATLVFTGAAVQYTLDLTSGTVTVTGDTAAATVHRVLTAAAASYAVTGDDLAFALLRAYVLNLTAGAVTVTGQPANLQLARVLAALAGDTTISGADLDFIIGGALFIAAQAGAMAATGFPADLIVRGIIQGLCPPKPGHLAEPEFGTLPAATPVELDTGRVCV